MLRIVHLTGLGALLLAAGCKVGPDYEGPESTRDLPSDFSGQVADPAFQGDPLDLQDWWKVFEDQLLTAMIERAAAENLDLRIALARVNEARSRVGIARSGGAPQVSAGLDVAQASSFQTGFQSRTISSAGVGASWELDAFGKIARAVESAEAAYEATKEDSRDVQVSLFAEIARAYLEVRSLQARLGAASRNIDSQRDILQLTETRQAGGISSALDVSQARQVMATSEAAVPPLRIALAREINTIAVLLAIPPERLHDELKAPQPIPVPDRSVSVGVPAELLRQRPDIRAAERRLASQTAAVGIATADLYPSFSINGSLGFQSLGGNLLDAGSQTFALGPSMRWNLFDGGRVRSQIDVEDSRLEQSLLLYERAVLNAIEEVESAMTAFTEQRISVEAVEAAATAARETLRLATRLYRDGLIGFQDVLDAQRAVFAAEIDVAQARGLAAQSMVDLYRALGGGWDPADNLEPDDTEVGDSGTGS